MTEASADALDLSLLEHHIEQHIQHWYVKQLGHSNVKVACHSVGDKLMMVLEESITQPERLLVASGRLDFAQQMHTALDQILRLHLQETIESLTRLRIVDLLTATQLETERTSIVVILSETITMENLAIDQLHLDEPVFERGDE
jgi:uncharacterized protein YbcI